jgi:hypothetical protein
MSVLVACEESQEVTKALRSLGITAYSCDILECSGGRPEWHIQQNCLELLHDSWELIIAFPPCTHLCSSGARWFKQKRLDGRQKAAIDFFMQFTDLTCPHVAIENSVGIMSSLWRKPDQIIQPWQFGHGETKATCLWLKGLPALAPTKVVSERKHTIHRMSQTPNRSRLRSKTFPGIAKAMAEQWSACLENS